MKLRRIGWAMAGIAFFGAGFVWRGWAPSNDGGDMPSGWSEALRQERSSSAVVAPTLAQYEEAIAIDHVDDSTVSIDGRWEVEVDLHPPMVAFLEADQTHPARPIPIPHDPHPPELTAPQPILLTEGPDLSPPPTNGLTERTAERDVPEPLPPPAQAEPIAPSRQAEELRRLFESELPNATEEERKIWQEEMKDLSPAVVRDLLQLRKQLRSHDEAEELRPSIPNVATRPQPLPPHDWPRRLPSLPGESDDSPDYGMLPPRPEADGSAIVDSAMQAALRARTALLQNIANARTPGYRREVVDFAELRGVVEHDEETIEAGGETAMETTVSLGAELSPPQFDHQSSGALRKTNEPLHVAIKGNGLIQVTARGQQRFTRCGRLTLDGRRRLCVRCNALVAPIEPEVTLPEDAGAVRIGETGVVEVQKGSGEDWVSVGEVKLFRFLNAAELQTCGNTLFAESMGSGTPQEGQPATGGYGALVSGHLEGSNVDLEREFEELEQIQQWLQALMAAAEFGPGAAVVSFGQPASGNACPVSAETDCDESESANPCAGDRRVRVGY